MIQFNGQWVDHIDVTDRGLQYGDGLFETIRVGKGRPTCWRKHLDRLENDAARLGIPLDRSLIEQESFHFLDKIIPSISNDGEGIMKLIVTRGSGGRGYRPPDSPRPSRIIQWHPLPPGLAQQQRDGMAVMQCAHPVSVNPALAGIKHLNRLDQVMASRELRAPYEEGFMLDPQGMLVEGTRSNVFMVQAGRLWTPALECCGVAGVLRSILLDRAPGEGLEVLSTRRQVTTLMEADEVFVCNSVAGILPVTEAQIEGTTIRFPAGSLTRHLQSRLPEWMDS
ncbi:MAG: aminodeoxychorismate lyase [Pseudomonadota bacterium]